MLQQSTSKNIFFPDNSFFQVHSNFSRILNKIIKFQYFSRTGKTVVIFPGFPAAVGNLRLLYSIAIQAHDTHHFYTQYKFLFKCTYLTLLMTSVLTLCIMRECVKFSSRVAFSLQPTRISFCTVLSSSTVGHWSSAHFNMSDVFFYNMQ